MNERIQAGGRSSATTCSTGLNSLNRWRVSPSVQNATTVSSGGQPGRRHDTCVTRIAASSASRNRSRVHSRTRASAAACASLRLKPCAKAGFVITARLPLGPL